MPAADIIDFMTSFSLPFVFD
ncbi:protein of unknown function [Nitratireductor aquimarinus]